MKAIVFKGARDVGVIEKEAPRITADNEVMIRVKSVGICGSDLHGLTRINGDYPRVPCHEFVGIVVEIGAAVTKVKLGDRVVPEPIRYCGECYACRHGRTNVCKSVVCAGARSSFPGGAQELWVTTEDKVFKIPDFLTWHQAVLTEPYTIGVQVNSRANTLAGDYMLIHGGGPVGLIIMDVAKKIGAKVIVSEIKEGRLEMAKRLGADYLINPLREDYKARVKEITSGMGPNVIVDAAGLPAMLSEAVDLISPAGSIVNMCFNNVQVPVSYMKMIRKETNLVGSRMQNGKFPVVLEQYADRLAAAEKVLVTDVFPADQGREAFELALSGKDTVGKIVIDF